MEQLSINNDMFASLREQFDEILNQTIANMMLKGTLEASMTVKLNIGILQDIVPTDEGSKEVYKPVFDHDISSVVQVKERVKGGVDEEYELIKNVENDKWEIKKLETQISMFDEGEPGENEVTDIKENYGQTLYDNFKPYVGDDMTVAHSDDGGYEIIDTTSVRPVVIASARKDGEVTGFIGFKPEELGQYLMRNFTIVGEPNGTGYSSLSLVCVDDGEVFITAYPD